MTRAGNVFANPLLYLNAYTLANPWVVWALERGLLDEWCPGCCGAGEVHERPCATCAGTGDVQFSEAHPELGFGTPDDDGPQKCPDCWRVCRECRGSRLRPDRPLCAQDFGDPESLAIARRLDREIDRPEKFYQRNLR